MEELEERLSVIYAARFRHELDAATADLPTTNTTKPGVNGWSAVLAIARHQLTADLMGLVGRGRTTISRRRKVLVAMESTATDSLPRAAV